MHRSVTGHRRVLVAAYHRYLAADRALAHATDAAVTWFPEPPGRGRMLIGDPGSRIRALYERRDRAMARLALVHRALREAERRSRSRSARRILLIAMR